MPDPYPEDPTTEEQGNYPGSDQTRSDNTVVTEDNSSDGSDEA